MLSALKKWLLCALLLFFTGFVTADSVVKPVSASDIAPILQVSYPYIKSDPVYEARSEYVAALLELILNKMDVPFELNPTDERTVPSSRTAMFINQGHFNVAALHTDPERERLMRPIRIPIFRGLGGWRLMFVRHTDTARFAQVKTLAQLKALIAGQGHDWPDTPILLQNGFAMRTSVNRDSLYQMLRLSRVDYFPRGLYEIWHEESLPQASGLTVESHIVLRYPTATYLYVSKDNESLASILEQGFEMAIADGSFNELFMAYFGETITRARLPERHLLEIPSTTLSAETPLARKSLWFSVDELH